MLHTMHRYDRVVSCSILALSLLVTEVMPVLHDPSADKQGDSTATSEQTLATIQRLFTDTLWKKMSSPVIAIRKAAYMLFTNVIEHIPQAVSAPASMQQQPQPADTIIQPVIPFPLVTKLIFDTLNDTEYSNVGALLSLILKFGQAFPVCWQAFDNKKQCVFANVCVQKLHNKLLALDYSNVVHFLLPLLASMPVELCSVSHTQGAAITPSTTDTDPTVPEQAANTQQPVNDCSQVVGSVFALLKTVCERGAATSALYNRDKFEESLCCVLECSAFVLLRGSKQTATADVGANTPAASLADTQVEVDAVVHGVVSELLDLIHQCIGSFIQNYKHLHTHRNHSISIPKSKHTQANPQHPRAHVLDSVCRVLYQLHRASEQQKLVCLSAAHWHAMLWDKLTQELLVCVQTSIRSGIDDVYGVDVDVDTAVVSARTHDKYREIVFGFLEHAKCLHAVFHKTLQLIHTNTQPPSSASTSPSPATGMLSVYTQLTQHLSIALANAHASTTTTTPANTLHLVLSLRCAIVLLELLQAVTHTATEQTHMQVLTESHWLSPVIAHVCVSAHSHDTVECLYVHYLSELKCLLSTCNAYNSAQYASFVCERMLQLLFVNSHNPQSSLASACKCFVFAHEFGLLLNSVIAARIESDNQNVHVLIVRMIEQILANEHTSTHTEEAGDEDVYDSDEAIMLKFVVACSHYAALNGFTFRLLADWKASAHTQTQATQTQTQQATNRHRLTHCKVLASLLATHVFAKENEFAHVCANHDAIIGSIQSCVCDIVLELFMHTVDDCAGTSSSKKTMSVCTHTANSTIVNPTLAVCDWSDVCAHIMPSILNTSAADTHSNSPRDRNKQTDRQIFIEMFVSLMRASWEQSSSVSAQTPTTSGSGVCVDAKGVYTLTPTQWARRLYAFIQLLTHTQTYTQSPSPSPLLGVLAGVGVGGSFQWAQHHRLLTTLFSVQTPTTTSTSTQTSSSADSGHGVWMIGSMLTRNVCLLTYIVSVLYELVSMASVHTHTDNDVATVVWGSCVDDCVLMLEMVRCLHTLKAIVDIGIDPASTQKIGGGTSNSNNKSVLDSLIIITDALSTSERGVRTHAGTQSIVNKVDVVYTHIAHTLTHAKRITAEQRHRLCAHILNEFRKNGCVFALGGLTGIFATNNVDSVLDLLRWCLGDSSSSAHTQADKHRYGNVSRAFVAYSPHIPLP
jgi:hypothetical protein